MKSNKNVKKKKKKVSKEIGKHLNKSKTLTAYNKVN